LTAGRGGGRMMARNVGGRPPARPGFGGGFGGMLPPQKTKDLGKTLRQLLARLRPERTRIIISAVLALGGVAGTVIGPKIIGNATNVIFDGVIGKSLPAGITKAQAVAGLRAQGHGQIADLVSGANVVPGRGIAVTQLGQSLLLAALVYLLASGLTWLLSYIMAGVAQRTVYGLRRDAEAKLARLPLKYFDSHVHGDMLSRVTNDIDNITTTLQQGMSQFLTSTLTIVGVLAVMVWISPLLAAVALVTVPLPIVVTLLVARRSQKHFAAQWARTGMLNGQVEQVHTGHALVQVFGRRQKAIEEFNQQNQALYEASFRAGFLSGIIMPAMAFLGNVNYVVIAAVGGYRVATGSITLGDVQAFIQYSRQFTIPISQLAGQLNLLQSGLASAERVFEFLGEEEETPDPVVL